MKEYIEMYERCIYTIVHRYSAKMERKYVEKKVDVLHEKLYKQKHCSTHTQSVYTQNIDEQKS